MGLGAALELGRGLGFGSLEGHLAALKGQPGVQVGVRGGGVLALEVGALSEGLLREKPHRHLVRVRARVWARVRVWVRARARAKARGRARARARVRVREAAS